MNLSANPTPNREAETRSTEKRPFRKALSALVAPIALQQFMLALVSASDAIMLGFIDQAMLSAVSLAGQIQFVYNLFILALTIGASMFAAQFWGKGDKERVEKLLAFVLRISLIVSAAFFLAATVIPSLLMRIFTADTALIEAGAPYLRTVAASYLFCGVSQIYLCILKNSGHATMSMIVSTSSVVINIGFNAVLIYGLLGIPALYTVGAAIATVLARLIEMLWSALFSFKENCCKFRWRYFARVNAVLRRKYWRYTLPVLGNELVWGVGFTMYTVIMGHLGSDATAANSVANIVKNLIACFCLGLGSGGGILVGNELGAGNLAKAKEYGNKLCKLSVIGGIVSGLLLLALMPAVLWLAKFTSLTKTAYEFLKWMLLICSVYMLGKSVNATLVSGIFCAGGDTKFGLLCDFITMWCIVVPFGFISAFLIDLPVQIVYLIVSLDEFIKIPAVLWRYRKYKWVKNLTIDFDPKEKEAKYEPL